MTTTKVCDHCCASCVTAEKLQEVLGILRDILPLAEGMYNELWGDVSINDEEGLRKAREILEEKP